MLNHERLDVSVYSRTHSEKRGSYFTDVLKGCAMCCYLLCPPVPDEITRKLAFHPPKGTYTAYLPDDPDVQIKSASKLVGKQFRIKPGQLTRCPYSDYEEIIRSVECFILRTTLGNLIVAVKCSPRTPGTEEKIKDMVVIFSQPNASDLGEYLQPFHMNIPMMAELLGTDVYAFDYSGYGLSTGKPSEKNIYADIRSVYDFVIQTRRDKKIVLLGYSLGTAAVTDLAASNPARVVGVVLVAPFTSGIRLFSNQPTRNESSKLDRFLIFEKVHRIKVPVLVCHGYRDDAIPVEHGLEIQRRAKRAVPPLILPEADHVSIFNGKFLHTYVRIREFLANETGQPTSISSVTSDEGTGKTAKSE
ncbi:hypothetical protein V3C99_011991 [Haemonchus contortus]